MKRIRIVGLALLAVFVMGAIVATAAQAVEAPYWGIESKRLASGQSEEVTVNQISEYTLSASGVAVTCKKSSVNAGGTIIGSNANEPGTSKETILFKECAVSTNGEGCKVGHNGNGEIQTESLKDELVYDATSKESKSVAVEFTPETGPVLAKITFFGEPCAPLAAGVIAVEGQIAAQAWGGTEKATEFLLELGKAPVLAVSGSLRFPATRITSVVLIVNGVAKLTPLSFSFAGKASKLIGSSEVKLVSGKKWCIIS